MYLLLLVRACLDFFFLFRKLTINASVILLFFTFSPFNETIEDYMLFTYQPFHDFFD